MSENQTIKTENWVCTNCGGTLKWDIQKQQFECASCRTPQNIESEQISVVEHDFDTYESLEKESVSFPDEISITCKTCGANIIFSKVETAKVCPMCASSQIASEKQTAGVSPDGIVPFMITKEQAQQNFHKWVKSRWFAPNQLKKAYQQGRLDGIYIPFWTFDAEVEGNYEGRGGQEHTVKGDDGKTTKIVEWDYVNGHVKGSFDDLAVCASEHKIAQVIDSILPFSTQEKSVPYASAYLSGFGAEHYAIGANIAFDKAWDKIEVNMKEKAKSTIKKKGYDRADISNIYLHYTELRYKQILSPVWASAFSYSNKQYLYLINGETGDVGGQRPYSIIKIIVAIILALLILFAGYTFFYADAEAKDCSTIDTTNYTIVQDYE